MGGLNQRAACVVQEAGWQSLPLLVTGEGASVGGVLQFLHALETRISSAAVAAPGTQRELWLSVVVTKQRPVILIMRAASPLALTPLLLVASLASVADGSLGINAAGARPLAISSVSCIKYDTSPA